MEHPPLYPFQERAVARFLEQKCLLVAHNVGMGKTRTAVEALRRLAANTPDFRALAVTPANLRDNFLKTMRQFAPCVKSAIARKADDVDTTAVPVVSFDFMRTHVRFLVRRRFDALVCDEFHHSKNRDTGNHACLSKLRTRMPCFLCLTGSPLQNSIREFWTLMDLVSGRPISGELDLCLERAWDERRVPFWKRWFLRLFSTRPVLGPLKGVADPLRFKSLASRWIDFVDDETASKSRPQVMSSQINVALTSSEWYIYRSVVAKTGKRALKALQSCEADNLEAIASKITSLALARQTLMCVNALDKECAEPELSAKALAVIEQVRKGPFPAIVYSNFFRHGAKAIHERLCSAGLDAVLLHGQMSNGERHDARDGFCGGKNDILVMTPVGGEGLDFPRVRSLHIVDPHWNPEVTRQTIGRAVRLSSVFPVLSVFHYIACGPNGQETIDHAIMSVSRRKEAVNQVIRRILTHPVQDNNPIPFHQAPTQGSDL